MQMKSTVRHLAHSVAQSSVIAILIVGMMAGSVFAGRGGGGKPGGGGSTSGGTIVMVPMDGATEAHYAARVTFTVSTSATPYPYVHLRCYQGGGLVAEGRQGFFPTAIGNEWFYLGPTGNWTGGAADCTATLEKYGTKAWTVLATTSFHVYE